MTLANYTDLKTKVASWLRRSGNSTYVSEVPDIIDLAESRLNRELGAVETSATITGTSSSRSIDVTAQSVVEPIALFLAESGIDEREVQPKAPGTFGYLTTNGRPSFYSLTGGITINFDRPLDSAYPFRFVYRQRFALSDSATTNWLLTYHPDVYLAASLMWGCTYLQSYGPAVGYKQILDEGIPSVRNIIAQGKRGVLTVDKALARRRGGRSYAEWAYDT